MDRKREKEGGRVQCCVKKEDKSLIDVDNVLRLTTFTKPCQIQMSFHLSFVCYFYLAQGLHPPPMTRLTDGTHSAPRPPTTHDSFKRVHH